MLDVFQFHSENQHFTNDFLSGFQVVYCTQAERLYLVIWKKTAVHLGGLPVADIATVPN